jgi:myosin heavy subunit
MSPASEPLLAEISSLLGFSVDALRASFTVRSLTIRGETTFIPFDQSAATDARNALAKEIYGRLFSFIVAQANESLRPAGGSSVTSSNGSSELSIGLLDIFGFEKFKVNSFEQLCINYCNEKLQQYFIGYILKKELELYAAEGISVQIEVLKIDNTDVLLLIEDKKKGAYSHKSSHHIYILMSNISQASSRSWTTS